MPKWPGVTDPMGRHKLSTTVSIGLVKTVKIAFIRCISSGMPIAILVP